MSEFNINDEIEIKIEKLINEGWGLGHVDGKSVFIENVAPEDFVKCKIVSANKNYLKAQIVEILEPSVHRVKPFCGLFNACGGCQWQHVEYNQQLIQKRNIVEETIKKIARLDVEVLPTIGAENNKNYRQKVQLPVGQTKNSKRFLTGYYRKKSHDLINIKHCPIQPAYFNQIIEFIKEKAPQYEITAYSEKTHKGELRHIIFRNSTTDNNSVLVLVVNSDFVSNKVKKLAKEVFDNFENILGVVANINTKKSNLILTDKFETLEGQNFILQTMENLTFKISAGSFFQVNPQSAVILLNTVKKFIEENTKNPTILDAYCGVGCFGLWMKDIASEVVAVEQNHSSVEDAKENLKINNAKNFKLYEGDVKDIFQNFIRENRTFDVVIIDPPRKGCSEEALEQIIKMSSKYIIYVSCNPATLAKDLKYLAENGFIPKKAQPVDMFPHSFHVETVCLLSKLSDAKHHVEVELNLDEMDLTSAESKATYEEIKSYVREHAGLNVSKLYIAQTKRKCGIIERENYNLPKNEDSRQSQCPPEKENAIMDALRHFGMLKTEKESL